MDIKRCKTLEASKDKDSENVGKENVVKQRVVGGWLLQLPLPLIYEILLRLNIETIFRCKCVCKTFLKILTNPYFAEIRLAKAPNIDNGLVIQDMKDIFDVLVVYNYKHEPEEGPCQTFSIPTVAAQRCKFSVFIVGSCNGLLCLRYRIGSLDFCYYICNPILGEFVALPQDTNKYAPSAQPFGFGFCPKTKQYKVIRFCTPSLCKIHTVGTDHGWRTITHPPPYPITLACFDSSYKGNLHWVRDNFTSSQMICSFSLETEQASILPTPIHLNNRYKLQKHKLTFIHTGTLGGLFCLSYLLDNTYYQVCVMKEYGVKESWTIDFNIDLTLISGLQQRNIIFVLKLWDNGDVFIHCKNSCLVCYSLYKGTITDLLAKNLTFICVVPFVPSFISLKDVARSDVEVVQRKMGRNLWSDQGFHFIA